MKSLRYYKTMVALVPLLIYDGFILGFVSTSSTNLMPKQSNIVEIGVFLIILGIGCVIGGFSSGLISDKIEMKNSGKLGILMTLMVSVLTTLISQF